MSAEEIVLGRISGLFGVRGWVKIFSYSDPPANICAYASWRLAETEYRVAGCRAHGKGIIAKLAEIDDRDAAAALIGSDIRVPRSALPPPQEDEFYWSDLVGARVVNREGDELGRVDYLFATGANDVMAVKGERERLLPFIAEVIEAVDLDQGTIRVDWDKDF